jgi:leucyl aminopeptidase
MIVGLSHEDAAESVADTIVLGLLEDEPAWSGAPAEVTAVIASGEARSSFCALALAHAPSRRWLLVGLGSRAELTPERARAAAALAAVRARELAAKTICWQAPTETSAALAGAIVEGTVLSSYRFEQFKSAPRGEAEVGGRALEQLVIAAPAGHAETIEQAAIVAERVNRARDLQNRPANDLTPTALGEYAASLAEQIDGLSVEVEHGEQIAARGMGAFSAVAQGSVEPPALITMRYSGAKAAGPTLGFVGKAVTFDSGGISLKPGAKMAEMKFDMSGGAAVIEATAAIAELGLPVKLISLIGATENLPSGRAVKPGDIVTASNGKTIEINNTDAEGRLVLADCLAHASAEGAERIVDLATLTGAVLVALGSTYAGLISNDDDLSAALTAAGEQTGELLWRLPLHPEYDKLIEGRFADLDNAPEAHKAGTILGGAFLSNFVGDVPWAHLDIAGTAWELDRAYVGKGASGFGVRLLVELARSFSRA